MSKAVKRKVETESENSRKLKKPKVVESTCDVEPSWRDYEILIDLNNISENIAKNVIKLFEEGDTIPFIARYRKHLTGNMNADELRLIKNSYELVNRLKKRIQSVYKLIIDEKDDDIKKSVLGARDEDTLDHIYNLFKPQATKSILEKALHHGLEAPALDILDNKPQNYSKFAYGDFASFDDVKNGIIHIIAQRIAKDPDLLKCVHDLKLGTKFILQTKKTQKRKESEENVENESKFTNYFDFDIPLRFIKPHQVLAINRGEKLKILTVKIDIPEYFYKKYKYFCIQKWNYQITHRECSIIIAESIEDCYKRIIVPMVKRQLRADLKLKAEKASIEVFSGNLKQLLLAPPIKQKTIMAIDPGFTHGCKIALVSPTGEVLDTAIIYPHGKLKNRQNIRQSDKEILKELLFKHNCDIIGLGNGTACRETETFLTTLIKEDYFKPLKIMYMIVNECGASIYSCSKEATKEFANLDPNLISAISLARRVLDPLSELVKVEPKHLGVGMYQHDVNTKQLDEVLDDVVSECVSFVGIDLNTASQCLLRHVAGLSDKKATSIINYRSENGQFRTREQLLKVASIGAVTFRQCAGFLKVDNKYNQLDATTVHPESYKIALDVVKQLNLKLSDIGSDHFIQSIKHFCDFDIICKKHSIPVDNLNVILESLSKPLNYDLRIESNRKPLFKDCITNVNDLNIGCVLTGSVNNVTHFGCFVDIGVGINGLIHISKMSKQELKIGDHVEVKVISTEIERKRISLELISKF